MRRKKWIILGVCMLFCMINIAGCVKKKARRLLQALPWIKS